MKDMEQMQCKSCGAHLKRRGFGEWVCEYCGAVYRVDESTPGEIRYIEVQQARAQTLQVQVKYPDEIALHIGEEALAERTVQDLTYELAKGLAPYMKVMVSKDYRGGLFGTETIVRGTVRVVPPDFRF